MTSYYVLIAEKHVYQIGVSFKMAYSKMIKVTFMALKELRMVWKRLNSEYVYKCQSGIPNDSKEDDPNRITYKNYEEKMIKCFIQFSKIDQCSKSVNEICSSNSTVEPEYL